MLDLCCCFVDGGYDWLGCLEAEVGVTACVASVLGDHYCLGTEFWAVPIDGDDVLRVCWIYEVLLQWLILSVAGADTWVW